MGGNCILWRPTCVSLLGSCGKTLWRFCAGKRAGIPPCRSVRPPPVWTCRRRHGNLVPDQKDLLPCLGVCSTSNPYPVLQLHMAGKHAGDCQGSAKLITGKAGFSFDKRLEQISSCECLAKISQIGVTSTRQILSPFRAEPRHKRQLQKQLPSSSKIWDVHAAVSCHWDVSSSIVAVLIII